MSKRSYAISKCTVTVYYLFRNLRLRFSWLVLKLIVLLCLKKYDTPLLLRCAALVVHSSNHLQDGDIDNFPVKQLFFCVGCPHPQHEGSIVNALIAKHSIRNYDFIGELVYCIPNGAESAKIINKYQFADRVVLVDRGQQTTIQDKINRIAGNENIAGALAIILADDGQCNTEFSYCGHRAGNAQDGGFAAHDDKIFWSELDIPVFLVTAASADRLKQGMNMKTMKIPRMGLQNVTILEEDEGNEL
mmetsp:Transcript_19951/g.28576  ORF Transcript_19951/g.28576 Transcript_19951/m.28576 type:complete len:246 (+) Transcript_19951:120-857(+)